MDNEKSDSLLSEAQLSFTEKSKRFLSEAGKWGKFISILGFIGIGLMVIFAIFAGTMFSNLPGGEELPFPGAVFSLIYLVIAALYVFPVLYLFRFSTKIREALNSNNEATLEYAFENLKSHYKFVGILAVVMIGIYILAFLVAIIVGAATAF